MSATHGLHWARTHNMKRQSWDLAPHEYGICSGMSFDTLPVPRAGFQPFSTSKTPPCSAWTQEKGRSYMPGLADHRDRRDISTFCCVCHTTVLEGLEVAVGWICVLSVENIWVDLRIVFQNSNSFGSLIFCQGSRDASPVHGWAALQTLVMPEFDGFLLRPWVFLKGGLYFCKSKDSMHAFENCTFATSSKPLFWLRVLCQNYVRATFGCILKRDFLEFLKNPGLSAEFHHVQGIFRGSVILRHSDIPKWWSKLMQNIEFCLQSATGLVTFAFNVTRSGLGEDPTYECLPPGGVSHRWLIYYTYYIIYLLELKSSGSQWGDDLHECLYTAFKAVVLV